jgi:hypothetical protein
MKRFLTPQVAVISLVVLVVCTVSVIGLADLMRRSSAVTPPATQPAASATAATVGQATPGTPIYLPVIGHGQEVIAPTPTPTPTMPPAPSARPRTPGPTHTPKPPRWPEPLAAPGRSRLGIHVIWNTSPDILEYVHRAKPIVVKAVGDLGWLKNVKEISPNTVTIGRLDLASQSVAGDPAAAARAFVAEHLAKFLEHPYVDYWEGWNEPDPNQIGWYTTFEAERVRALAGYGLKAAIGSFATGTPEWEQFLTFLPAVEAALQHGGILSLHEYDAPTFDRTIGSPIPGRPPYPDRGPLALRYRYWYEDVLKPRGLTIPLVITEAGVDGGVRDRPGPADATGWRHFATYWSQHGLGDDATQVYLRQLAWYDAEVQKDDYVIGFTVYTAGSPSAQWESFEITQILPKLAYYAVSQQ